MARKRAALSVVGVVVCALSLVGCANGGLSTLSKKATVTTSASASSATASNDCQTSPNLISACTRLGDLTTLDPCGLISLGELPPDLAASPGDRDSLDHCDFTIAAGSDKSVLLEIGQLEPAVGNGVRFGAGSEELQPQGLSLEEGSLDRGECDDALQFGGDLVDLEINAFVLTGAGSPALCAAVTEVGKALGNVLNGKAQMPHFTVPKNSIARLKACGLVNGAQIGSYTVDGQPDSASGHSCQWQPDSTNPAVEVGIILKIDRNLDTVGARSQIDGLNSYTVKYSPTDFSRCEVDANRAPWGTAGNGLMEIASVWAMEPAGQVDTACSLATQLANVVWPKLPPLRS
ncbi:MAG TPA: hypothetical protein VGM75_21355 [Pseudonocardiaceae bacterium]